jgi:putative Holliday junction resolvase
MGRKRTGIAVSDPGRMIANGLETIPTMQVWDFLEGYMGRENVEVFVVGYPFQMNGTPSESMPYVASFVKNLKKRYPEVDVALMDERFTSKMARQSMLDGGLKKKDRRDKSLVDKISAVLILQSYLDQQTRDA